MKVTLSTEALAKCRADLLAVGVRKGTLEKDAGLKALDRATGNALRNAAKLEDFSGKTGEVLRVAVRGAGAKVVLLVGLGDGAPKAKEARAVAVRGAAAAAKYATVAIAVAGEGPDAIAAAAEGALTGAHKFTRYLTGDRAPKRQLESAKLIVAKRDAASQRALERGVVLAESITLVRDLVNAPPNDLTPVALALAAKEGAEKASVSYREWNKKGLDTLGMRLFLAVNRGSAEEPRMVQLSYVPKGVQKPKRVVFVGKGLTFDSGGLCIKPAGAMIDMKCDMAGAATTIGIVLAAARLEVPLEIHGFFGATENMTGASAYRPGDVFKSHLGKTVEIINTDAEGRLVLADVLSHATSLKPDYLIDHATLTGACMVALGPWTAGLFSNDDGLAQRYAAAAEAEGEQYWRMPLVRDLRESLRSEVADLKHTGDKHGGAITAALFLEEFVGKCKWMHLDIAGPAFLERSHAQYPKGGTGFGVATGVRFLELLAKET